jgi:cobalt-zinc-cadmium efflux system protein
MEHEHTALRNRSGQRRALWIVLVANGALMAGEVIGGLAFHSLALLADSVHLLTDLSGLAIALVALRLADRPATSRLTFGMQRAEVLAAQGNGMVLLAAPGWIIYEAVRRLVHPEHVSGSGLAVVAGIGLVVNLGSAAHGSSAARPTRA